MMDRSDHLIERAAALLRSANAGQVVEQSGPLPSAPIDGQNAGATSTEISRGAKPGIGHPPPKFVPPPRPPTPSQHGPVPTASQKQGSALARGGRVADLRSITTHPPVDLATLERAGLMVARNHRTRTTEEYRIVIGRVLRALHDETETDLLLGVGSANVVMVTSARPGEGKSFSALNLGGSIAQNAGESVLIVDVDSKPNSLTEQLGLSARTGFLDLVARPELSIEDMIVPSELQNLSFLPLGNRALDEAGGGVEHSLQEGRRLTPPIVQLATRFPKSLIVLDSPPCLSTSDPHTLAPMVGQVVMVVEAERTQRAEVEAALELVKVCPIVTMLLNKVRSSPGHTFGSYDYFGSYT